MPPAVFFISTLFNQVECVHSNYGNMKARTSRYLCVYVTLYVGGRVPYLRGEKLETDVGDLRHSTRAPRLRGIRCMCPESFPAAAAKLAINLIPRFNVNARRACRRALEDLRENANYHKISYPRNAPRSGECGVGATGFTIQSQFYENGRDQSRTEFARFAMIKRRHKYFFFSIYSILFEGSRG